MMILRRTGGWLAPLLLFLLLDCPSFWEKRQVLAAAAENPINVRKPLTRKGDATAAVEENDLLLPPLPTPQVVSAPSRDDSECGVDVISDDDDEVCFAKRRLAEEAQLKEAPAKPAGQIRQGDFSAEDEKGGVGSEEKLQTAVPLGQEEAENSHPFNVPNIWEIDGLTLVDHGMPVPVDVPMGFLQLIAASPQEIIGRYVLGNEVTFKLSPMGGSGVEGGSGAPFPAHWRVGQIHRTAHTGSPVDVMCEETVRQLFLHFDAQLRIEPIGPLLNSPPHRMRIVNELDCSVEIVNLPQSLARPRSAFEDLEGIWVAAFPLKGGGNDTTDNNTNLSLASDSPHLDLTLTLVPTSPLSFSISLDGINHYEAHVKHDRNLGNLTFGPVTSTHLQPLDPQSDALERAIVRDICASSQLHIVRPTEDDASAATLAGAASSGTGGEPELHFLRLDQDGGSVPNSVVKFHRKQYSTRFRHYHEVPLSRWAWIPHSLLLQSANGTQPVSPAYLASLGPLPVLLEVRRAGQASLLDLYVGSAAHLRAAFLPTSGGSDHALTFYQRLLFPIAPDHPVTNLATTLEDLLKTFVSIDIGSTGDYLSIIGPHSSLSFAVIPGPSAGVWAFELQASQLDAESRKAAYQAKTRATMSIEKVDTEYLAEIRGEKKSIRFKIVNESPTPALVDWRARQIGVLDSSAPASESHGQEGEAAGDPTTSAFDNLLLGFFTSVNPKVQVLRHESMVAIGFMKYNESIVFVHPVDLVMGLLGDWELTAMTPAPSEPEEMHATLELSGAGIGELFGKFETAQATYKVNMHEVFSSGANDHHLPTPKISEDVNNEAMLVPATWNINLRPYQLPRRYIGQRHDNDAIAATLERCHAIDVKHSKLQLYCDGNSTMEFVRTLDRQVGALLEGDWILELSLISNAAEALSGGGGVGSSASLSSTTSANMPPPVIPHALEFHVRRMDKQDGTMTTTTSLQNGKLSYFDADISPKDIGVTLGKVEFTVDPYGTVRFVKFTRNPELSSPGNAMADSLESFVTKAIASSDLQDNKKAPFALELTPSDMIMTNGEAMLLLSRKMSAGLVIVETLYGNLEEPPLIVDQRMRGGAGGLAQSSAILLRKLEAEAAAAAKIPRADRVVNVIRRRLEAASHLNKLVYAESQ